MTTLLDPETGQPVLLPTGVAEDALLSGKVGVDGSTVNMVDPDDKQTRPVPLELLQGAIDAGAHVEQPHEEALRVTKKVIEDNPVTSSVAAFSSQFANQATLGAFGTAQDIIDDKDSARGLAKQVSQEEHPWFNAIGGISGGALTLLYSPIAKGVGWLGDAASDTAAQLAKTVGIDAANKYVARVASLTVKYGAEGAALSLPRAITPPVADVLLGNPEEVGEHLIAGAHTVGEGILVGAGLGLVGGAVESPIATVLKAGSKALDSESLTNVANRFALKQFDIFKAGFNKVQKLDPAASLEDNIQNVVDFANNKSTGFNSTMTPMERAARVYEYKGELEQSLNNVRAEADKLIPQGESIEDSVLKPMQNLANKLSDDKKSVEDIASVAGQIRSSMGKVAYNRFEVATKELLGLGAEDQLPLGLTPTFYDAEGNQVLNSAGGAVAIPRTQDGTFLVPDDFAMTHAERARIKTGPLKEMVYPAPDPARPWYRPNPSSPGAEAAYQMYENATEDSLERLLKTDGSDNLNTAYTDLKGKISNIYKMQDIFTDAAKNYAARNQISLGDQISAVAGANVDGLPGAIGGGLLNYMKRKYGNQLTANALYKAAAVVDKLHESSLGTISSAILDEAKTGAAPASIDALSQFFGDDPAAPKTKPEQMAALGQMIAKYQTDARTSAQLNGAITQPFAQMMPQTAGFMGVTLMNGINYLGQNIPQPTTPKTPLNSGSFSPTDRQVSQFERKLATVMDPSSALHDIASGTLTKDQVDVLKNVYPSYLRALQSRATALLVPGLDIPSKAKSSLRMLLGESVTERPGQAIQLLQENFMQEHSSAKPGTNSKINQAGRVGTGLSNRAGM